MTPAQAIAALDRQISAHGQTIKFKRGAGAAIEMRGFVRGFKPADLVGVIDQGDRRVVLSPSTLGAFGIPQALDKATIAGAPVTVTSVEPVYLADVLVRLNLVVGG